MGKLGRVRQISVSRPQLGVAQVIGVIRTESVDTSEGEERDANKCGSFVMGGLGLIGINNRERDGSLEYRKRGKKMIESVEEEKD